MIKNLVILKFRKNYENKFTRKLKKSLPLDFFLTLFSDTPCILPNTEHHNHNAVKNLENKLHYYSCRVANELTVTFPRHFYQGKFKNITNKFSQYVYTPCNFMAVEYK